MKKTPFREGEYPSRKDLKKQEQTIEKSILKKDEKVLDKPRWDGYNKRVLFEPPV